MKILALTGTATVSTATPTAVPIAISGRACGDPRLSVGHAIGRTATITYATTITMGVAMASTATPMA